jgi:hypothetical protein
VEKMPKNAGFFGNFLVPQVSNRTLGESSSNLVTLFLGYKMWHTTKLEQRDLKND